MQNSLWSYNVVVLCICMMMMMMVVVVVGTTGGVENGIREVGLGVILDMDSNVGKTSYVCILMAIEEFYGAHNHNFTTFIRPHFRDANFDNFQAASAAIDLLESTRVMALLGPQQSSQANFVLDIASRFKVPIISPATSPDLSSKQNPYFIRIAQTSSTQAEPIAALVKSFGWREVAFVYEDTDFGRGPIPSLFDAMENSGTQVKCRSLLSPLSSDDAIVQQLYKLGNLQTRVFVVHMLPNIATRFFKKVNELGMMTRGYVWVITDVLVGLLHHLDPQDLESMQGVIGFKSYIPPSKRLTNFERKWRMRFQKEYPEMVRVELDMFGIWSYDFVISLASALQRVEFESSANGTTEMGSKILKTIQNITRKGLSGDFRVVNGQLQKSDYQIVNVIGNGMKQIGFWNPMNGLSNQISQNHNVGYTTNKDSLGAIIWPGDSLEIPNGWDTGRKLRVGVPALDAFSELMEAYIDPITKKTIVSGLCIDVFYAVIDAMGDAGHGLNYDFLAFETFDGKRSTGNFDDLIYQVYIGKYDLAAGDVTILSNRSNYVDFTLPFSDSGVAMLVPFKVDDRKNAWIFLQPLERNLWITIGAFFLYTGFVIWVLEHRVNKEFRGPPNQQVGMMLWYSFSTLVFAHREKISNNLAKFVVIVWVFVVLVLSTNYTASLASMLTVRKLQPTFSDINDLIAKGESIGCQNGSFVKNMLIGMGVSSDKLKGYTNFDEYVKALSDGSKNGGVSAIVDEVPYLKLVQAKNCNKFFMGDPFYNTAGFGIAFPKESPVVVEFSRAILKVIEGTMKNISNKWIGTQGDCSKQNVEFQSFDRLKLASFSGLFLIAGLSSTCALVVSMCNFFYENKEILVSQESLREKMIALIRSFDEEKDKKPPEIETVAIEDSDVCVEETMAETPLLSSTICIEHQPKVCIEHQPETIASPSQNENPEPNLTLIKSPAK